MAANYDPALPTLKDWVRLQVGDRGPVYLLSDEEINATLAREKNEFLAAASCGDVILQRGQGATSKSVGGLSISFGDSPESAYRAHLQRLREQGAEAVLKLSGSSVLRTF